MIESRENIEKMRFAAGKKEWASRRKKNKDQADTSADAVETMQEGEVCAVWWVLSSNVLGPERQEEGCWEDNLSMLCKSFMHSI